MADQFRAEHERRAFARLTMQVPVELHQGGAVWELELIDISLTGLAVTEPDDWDADYSHPFNFIIKLPQGEPLEFYAHLIHINPGHMGFEMEHLEEDQLQRLAELMRAGLGEELVREQLEALEETRREQGF
jgi:hypothetical protein